MHCSVVRVLVTAVALLSLTACPPTPPPPDASCPAGFSSCNGACVALKTDPDNCGACGNACAVNAICRDGSCRAICSAGETLCGNTCANTRSDPANCGACGNACAAGQTCVSGQCTVSCPVGQTLCNGACVTTSTDPRHCGTCGNACTPGQVCASGTCSSACPPGQSSCEGACVTTSTDPRHCGACGNACTAGQVCSSGSCLAVCPAGQTSCNGACVSTQSDSSHCGACGNACADNAVCRNGSCRVICSAGTALCGSSCVDTSSSTSHCGTCGNACRAGYACVNGRCSTDCGVGQVQCSGACTNLGTDPNNCGACGNACPASQRCIQGACQGACESNLVQALPDPWGYWWDGLERPSTTYAQAKDACAAIGGRLPTGSELHRVSAVQSGAVGDTYATNYLWSLAPYSPGNQVISRLSDGAMTYSDSTTTTRPYRCVCPNGLPISFTGSACHGPPRAGCFTTPNASARYHIDMVDRPPMSKGAAMWECAFYRAHLADYVTYAEAILAGLPNGSGSWLHTADDAEYRYDTLVKWLNIQTSWPADSNTTVATTTDFRPFRCAGPAQPAGTHPNTVTNEFVGALGGNKGEAVDTPTVGWATAHDTCWNRGGHLPRSTELGELVQQGLPGGTNEWLWTSDQMGYNGTQFLAGVVRWTGVAPSYGHYYSTFLSWNYKTVAGHPLRCIYYPINTQYTGPATNDCNGGCMQFTLPGTTPAVMWMDNRDRTAATLGSAINLCASRGGHLASERDYTEAIRHGLPNGSNTWLLTSDIGHGGSSTNVMVIRWTGTDTGFTDQYSTYSTWTGLNSVSPYRCMWTNELR